MKEKPLSPDSLSGTGSGVVWGGPSSTMDLQISDYVASLLGLQGRSLDVNTLCTSSLSAIFEAQSYLLTGDCSPFVFVLSASQYKAPEGSATAVEGFKKAQILSATNVALPFGEKRNGTVPSEFAAALLLTSFPHAARAGMRVLGTIAGVATGRVRFSAVGGHNPADQAKVAGMALAKANVGHNDISYMECNALGTGVGDMLEYDFIKKAYGARSKESGMFASLDCFLSLFYSPLDSIHSPFCRQLSELRTHVHHSPYTSHPSLRSIHFQLSFQGSPCSAAAGSSRAHAWPLHPREQHVRFLKNTLSPAQGRAARHWSDVCSLGKDGLQCDTLQSARCEGSSPPS
mgnify:CR=1 FL=1